MYVLLEFWQKTIAIPIMNPLSWFMILSYVSSQQPVSVFLFPLVVNGCFISIVPLIETGAYESAKEHETRCHHNPNYVTSFEMNWTTRANIT